MPLPRPSQEHPASSHAKWGDLKFTVMPEIAKHPDRPDQWKVSGVARNFASKTHAEKVRDFLKTNPSSEIKQALTQGQNVDHLLPGHLKKLPTWDAVHGVKAEGASAKPLSGIGKPSRRVGMQPTDKPKTDTHGYHPPKWESLLHPLMFGRLAEIFEYTRGALDCGCIDKLEWSAEMFLDVLGLGTSLEEWRTRRRIGVRQAKKFKKVRKLKKGKALKLRRAQKMYRPVRKKEAYNRHR